MRHSTRKWLSSTLGISWPIYSHLPLQQLGAWMNQASVNLIMTWHRPNIIWMGFFFRFGGTEQFGEWLFWTNLFHETNSNNLRNSKRTILPLSSSLSSHWSESLTNHTLIVYLFLPYFLFHISCPLAHSSLYPARILPAWLHHSTPLSTQCHQCIVAARKWERHSITVLTESLMSRFCCVLLAKRQEQTDSGPSSKSSALCPNKTDTVWYGSHW